MSRGSAQNLYLTRVQIGEIFWSETPLDLRISGDRAGAGARNVSEHAIKQCFCRHPANVAGDYLDIFRQNPLAENLGAALVQFDCDDSGVGIAICDGPSLAAWCGAAIENTIPLPDKRRHQLGGFILNCDSAVRIRACLSDVSGKNAASIREQGTGRKVNAFRAQVVLSGRISKADGCDRRRLIKSAYLRGGFWAELLGPALNQPEGMRGRLCNRLCVGRRQQSLLVAVDALRMIRQLAQDGVRKRRC